MPGDAVLTRDGPVSVPLDYVVPQSGELLPLTVRATMDGSGAAAGFYATVQVIAPTGRVMGNYITVPIAAGASADVTWFHGVAPIPSSSAVLPGTGVDRHVTTQTIPTSTSTNISFDSVLFDDLGWFNPADPTKVTVNRDGQFLILYTFAWKYPGVGGFQIQTGVSHNAGVTIVSTQQITAVASTPNAQSGGGVVNAAAGDVFTLFCYQNSAGNQQTWVAGSSGTDVQPFPTLTVIRIGDRV